MALSPSTQGPPTLQDKNHIPWSLIEPQSGTSWTQLSCSSCPLYEGRLSWAPLFACCTHFILCFFILTPRFQMPSSCDPSDYKMPIMSMAASLLSFLSFFSKLLGVP